MSILTMSYDTKDVAILEYMSANAFSTDGEEYT